MSIVLVILIGLAAGAVTRAFMNPESPGAWWTCGVLGVAGSVAAYALAYAAGWRGDPGDGLALHSAAIGGIGVLAMYRMLRAEP